MTWHTFIIIGMGIFWYRAAQHENESAVVWVGLSIVCNVLAMHLFGSVVSMLLSQVLLLVGITVWRAFGPSSSDP